MNCTAATDQFSSYLEGELSQEASSNLEQHFAECASCQASYESFRYALGDLQSLSLRETSRAETSAIMAAVDRSSQTGGGRTKTALTHLVAASVGAVLVWLFWPADVRVEERLVETQVEVPFEVVVEKLVQVEVPVEVEKLVQVEVPVEVERIVEVPVEVERVVARLNPAQVHVDRLAAMGDALVRLADLAEEEAEQREPEMPLAEASTPSPRSAPRNRQTSPVRVVRAGDQLTLQTRGSTAEVVPALIAMLSDSDVRARRVAEERLERIRGELGGELPASLEHEPSRRPNGIDRLRSFVHGSPEEDEASAQQSPTESWRTWWNSRGDELAALETQPTL